MNYTTRELLEELVNRLERHQVYHGSMAHKNPIPGLRTVELVEEELKWEARKIEAMQEAIEMIKYTKPKKVKRDDQS